MSQAKRHILPFFIPHLGCPNQCIFCDQHKIAGQGLPPTPEEVAATLARLDRQAASKPEAAFYGGSFTAIPREMQIGYLTAAKQALDEGRISGIRLSTRPDAVDEPELALLKSYGVGTVELGVQSMTDKVLKLARRGHTAADSLAAVRRLQEWGFVCGVQLMPGLPGETAASAVNGAAQILALKPDLLRIYPTVVVAGTECERMFRAGEFQPLSVDEAALICLNVTLLAEAAGTTVIRTGLQPTEELEREVVAGPYHPAFGAQVMGLLWRHKLLYALQKLPQAAECFVNKRDIAPLVGYRRQNVAYYPAGLRIRGAELAPGALRLRAADGGEFMLTEAAFREFWLAGLARAGACVLPPNLVK